MSVNVFHIIWKNFGTDTFKAFLRSYQANDSGHPHRLIVIFKGFRNEEEAREYRALLKDVQHEPLFVEDKGYDIGAYLQAVRAFQADYYCFFNSKSVILADDWLAKMYSRAKQTSIGLVGATGSWESLYTDLIHHRNSRSGASYLRFLVRASALNRLRHLYYYPAFPNHHIRTNAFMIRRETLNRVKIKRLKTRLDTSRFENGRIGLTRQILAMKLDAVVVGKDGTSFSPREWPDSATFWHGNQENLLVADNQTQKYAASDASEKTALIRRAWGPA